MSERFQIVLRALPSTYPAAARLKRFLKAALRQYGLRAERVEQLPDAGGQASGGQASGAPASPALDHGIGQTEAATP